MDPGEEVTFELRDSRDGTLTRDSPHEDLLAIPSLAHPLTGPLEVRGAEPGDVLEVEVLGYETDDFAGPAIWPGSGFLGDLFDRPFLARWELDGERARSEDVPGVAVPAGVFAGVIGVAPVGGALRARARARGGPGRHAAETSTCRAPSWRRRRRRPTACAPTRRARTAATSTSATSVAGSRLLLPVHAPGALLSIGDLHFAQGDGEVCISAIETGGTATVRVGLRRDGWRPRFPAWETPPRPGAALLRHHRHPARPTTARNEQLDLNLATRRALIEMLDWLTQEHGLAREPAYVLMSAAVELRVSELVDAPNALVSAALPLDVFEDVTPAGGPPRRSRVPGSPAARPVPSSALIGQRDLDRAKSPCRRRALRRVERGGRRDLELVASDPALASEAIASSGRSIVRGTPSSVTGIGVAWLPTTRPVPSTIWAYTCVAPGYGGAAVGELQRRLADHVRVPARGRQRHLDGVRPRAWPRSARRTGCAGAIGSVFWPVIAVSEPRRGSG